MLRIKALGGLSVWSGDNPITGPAVQPRRLAVIALLARAGARGITREKVIGFLWPDTDDERARRLLSQAVYMLRRDLGSEDAIAGARDLRLGTEFITCDVAEFQAAVESQSYERAAALYGGPFLDGFHLPGAGEFERWMEEERASLAHAFASALEKLAKQATARGDHSAAVEWWRKLASQDPLNARLALGLMHALVAMGDRHAAIQHARIYESLVEQDLEIAPDAEVVAFATKLRAQQQSAGQAPPPPPVERVVAVQHVSSHSPSEPPVPNAIVAAAPAAPYNHAGPPAPGAAPRRRVVATTVAALTTLVVVALVTYGLRARAAARVPQPAPVIAVGRIADYRTAPTSELARPLTDMLATDLAASPGFRVVSTARLYELMRQLGSAGDTTGGAHVQAARQAGATRMLDGALYEVDGGLLRLDLRLVELATGNVLKVYSVNGNDPFALADNGTARIVADAGATVPAGSLADRTTRSLTAYRLYEDGLRHFVAGDSAAARSLLGAALAADSNFAMAAFYLGRTGRTQGDRIVLLGRARQLARGASDRERLIIQAGWAHELGAPELSALAETLAVRYPDEVDGHFYAGASAVLEGRFDAALPHLNRVIEMDSLGLRGAVAGCTACDAFASLVAAYQMMDSLPQAVREARRWTRLQPRSPTAWQAMADVLDQSGQGDAALAAQRTFAGLGTTPDGGLTLLATHHLRVGSYDEAERVLRQVTQSGDPFVQADGFWFTAISLRQRARPTEALAAARRYRRTYPDAGPFNRSMVSASMEAQVLFELGRYAAAAALFDSIARVPGSELPSLRARGGAWLLTHVATARASAGDTNRLPWLADTIESLGALTGRGRDRRLHHHVRGLLWLARQRPNEAVTEFREAIYSPSHGYTRTNYELGKLYLRLDRPRDAVAILQPALRGPLEASNLYVTRTELHELLAEAHERAGARDSAATHYAAVVAAWREAEPQFKPRWEAARERLGRLK